jgi:small subunit ribosomal protein S6
MKAYELLYFIDPTLEDDAKAATAKRVEETITSQGGVIDNVDEWGKRKLAYEIDKLQEGEYTLVEFHAAPESIAELSRVLRISDNVVRSMIVRRDDSD